MVLAPIATVRDRIREMLRAVQFHRHSGISAQEIDFKVSQAIEWDRQRDVEAESPLGVQQRLQPPIEEPFGRATRPVCAVSIWRHHPSDADEEARERHVYSMLCL